jgi:hypothetical protein
MEIEYKFEYPGRQPFKISDEVYIIDDNGYDIFEAIIKTKVNDRYEIHYPEYPDDDGFVHKSRILFQTEQNKKIFEEQEESRKQTEQELKESPTEISANQSPSDLVLNFPKKTLFKFSKVFTSITKSNVKENTIQIFF